MSLGMESSTSKIPYGSCCPASFDNNPLVFKLLSDLRLLELKEEWVDLPMAPDFSSSMALVVLISLKKMQIKHFMMLSDSLLGCNFWVLSSNGLESDSTFRSKLKEISESCSVVCK